MELEGEHPGVKQSMLKALGNVAPRHLLDFRLNPPAELRATTRSSPGAEVAREDEPSCALGTAPPSSRAYQVCDVLTTTAA